LITEDSLRNAAATIGEISSAELRYKLSQLRQVREARSQLEVLRQHSEFNTLELDKAAYQLASQAQADGDLHTAARWYRAAALNDFANASLELAKILHSLADRYLADAESQLFEHEEMLLGVEAAHWYVAAFVAGEIEAASFLDELIARHDPSRLYRSR
jgi:hypothetical protein